VGEHLRTDPAKVIIEIDGGQHKGRKSYDEARAAWLASQGFEVMRFWNNDVLRDAEAVVQAVYRKLIGQRAYCESTPTPTLPHEGGGGKGIAEEL
jgi:very-short-patch-repair endonuclease